MLKLVQVFVLLLILALLSFSLNYMLLPNLVPYDDKRVMELIIIGGALVWIVLGGLKKTGLDMRLSWWLKFGLCCFWFLAVLSSFSAASPRYGFLEACLFGGLFYLSILIANTWCEYRQLWLISLISSLILGAIFYMIGFYMGYLASVLEAIPLVWPEPFFMMSNVRQFNQYQLWTLGLIGLPLLVSSPIQNVSKRWGGCLMSTWWVLLFASGSRGVLLAWFLSMFATWWIYRHYARAFLFLQLKSFSFGLSGYWVLFVFLPNMNASGGGQQATETVLRTDSYDRIYLWKQAWAMIEMHPWLGVGPMHYAWYPHNIGAHPHNSLVQLACEFGMPATCLLVLILGYGIYQWMKRFNSTRLENSSELERALSIALFFTVVAAATYSMVDGVIVMPLSQVMMALVLGLMLGVYHQDGITKTISSVNDVVHRLCAMIVLSVLMWAVLPELLPRVLGDFEFIPTRYQVFGPRFWEEGGIPYID